MANTWDCSKQTKGCTIDVRPYEDVDNVIGSEYDDIIRGNSKNNELIGGAGSDQIWGGSGCESDTMQDSTGANMFWWGNGEGNDYIQSSGSGSAIYLHNFGFAERTCYFSGNDFIWSKKNGIDAVNITGWLAQDAKTRIQSFVCNEGGVSKAYAWNAGAEIEVNLYDAYNYSRTNYLQCVDTSNAVLRGSTGNDTILGGAGNDKIWGAAGGNDFLSGGAGADRYWWDSGDGNDTIEGDASDAITFWKSSKGSVFSRLDGNDLTVYSSTDTLTIKNWANAKIDSVTYADGSTGTLTETLISASTHRFNIEVDYRYDTQGFYTDYFKSLVDVAVNEWEDRITSDFATMPAGTVFYINGTQYTLDHDVDDLVIFPKTFTNSSSGGMFNVSSLSRTNSEYGRTNTSFYQPFAGGVLVNSSWNWDRDGNVVSGEKNLKSTIAHEIGHVLGVFIGSNAYMSNVDLINGAYYFTGANATAANGGNYVPVLYERQHEVISITNSVMSYASGRSSSPTNVDFAMLKDVGYNII